MSRSFERSWVSTSHFPSLYLRPSEEVKQAKVVCHQDEHADTERGRTATPVNSLDWLL